MRSILGILSVTIMCYACSAGNYRLSEYEKGKLRGYHANEAQRLIDINKKNQKTNRKAAEKFRQQQSAKLNELNRSNMEKKAIKNPKAPSQAPNQW